MSELSQTIIIGFNPARLRGEPQHRSDLIRSLTETNLEANNKSDCKKDKARPRRAKKLNLSTTIENNIWNPSWRDSIIPWTASLRAYQRPCKIQTTKHPNIMNSRRKALGNKQIPRVTEIVRIANTNFWTD